MQTYDFLMLFVLGGLTIYGFSKGMAWQLAYLGSFIASYFVAVKFSDRLAPMFGQQAPLNKFAAMLAIYVVTSFLIWMVFRFVRRGIDQVKLQNFDRQMGALIGAARGVLWCVGITFFAVTLLPAAQKQAVIGSQSGRYIAKFIDNADAVMPPEVHQVVRPYLDRLEGELNQGSPAAQQGNFQSNHQGNFGGSGYQQPASQQGWPQQTQQGQGGWPGATQQQPQSGWPTNAGWPAQQGQYQQGQYQQGGTPAQSTGWPNQQQPAGGWNR